MPSCHLPEKNGARLQFGGLTQTQKKIGPIGPFPSGVGVDEKEIGNDGTKSTEHGDECGLADLFAQTKGERAGRDPIARGLHF